ncbi:protein PSK SIMULATOR 1-like [Arachis hypogaea]|uniref:DUF668 domain-containing protein n=1 Tax=Arachis hypogaea TaxID=3818 RepID=A0A445E7M5_ARAHY|nr:uncharacterized protein LOC112728881 [Arachis hypogaea]XP_025634994.1 uncharacterized protein LOC112728881 [Arachis hypogaea]XP_025663591.1 uncharacterized protein LOC112758997 [Arachis hypogaea]XP_025663596.1 uncharacterized protein LOC112758997 [Arachis hypogaea]QHO26013.1 uncharacterized protein DS421_12g385980 [Arachis hypogaea]RYR71305.1 hypothetical protein Ahy_A02g005577 [Arachis hypogaea]
MGGGETVNGAWLSAIWPLSRKIVSDEKEAIGILASEIVGVMSKIVNLWHSLSDRGVASLKEWITNSVGVKMLVSDDYYYLMELALDEILSSFQCLARYVARLGKRCKDPVYHRYESFVRNPAKNYVQWCGWEYAWKKMDRKVKKMERFVAAMSQLFQELEVLEDRQRTLKRMKANPKTHKGKLAEFEKKFNWHQQEVKNLKDISPWNRSFDYIVRLLARSLFTILERIILVFGNIHLPISQQQGDSIIIESKHALRRSPSLPVNTSSYVHPSETKRPVSSESEAEKKKNKNKNKNIKKELQQSRHIGAFQGVSKRYIDSQSCRIRIYSKLPEKGCFLKTAQLTLGDAALALHYANVIELIEKIVSSPHLIDHHTRDDLYSKLPTTIRTDLRAKLKWYAKRKHDPSIAAEWSVAMTQILGWLAPLAHNMIRWHEERNFEKEHTTSEASVLLVQTLYFANKAKTEAAIVELLVGLNYVCRINREAQIREARQPEFSRSRSFNRAQLRNHDLCYEI